jgi:hypothetical protein
VIILPLVTIALLLGLSAVSYLLGFQLGEKARVEELVRIQVLADRARREMATTCRQALEAMLAAVEQRRRGQ